MKMNSANLKRVKGVLFAFIMLGLVLGTSCADNKAESDPSGCPCKLKTASITLDGDLADWAAIAPILSDPEDDGDLKAVYLAKNGDTLYLALEVYNGGTYFSFTYFDNNMDNDMGDIEDRIVKPDVSSLDVTNGDNPPKSYTVNSSVAGTTTVFEASASISEMGLPETFLFGQSLKDASGDVLDDTDFVAVRI